MKLGSRLYLVSLAVIIQLLVSGHASAEAVENSARSIEGEIVLPAPESQKNHLTLVSVSPVVAENEIVGAVAWFDDPSTERPADFWELYDAEGDLVAVNWFDGFGIQRMAVDRGLLEQADKPEGVFVVLLDGDSV